MPSPQRFNSLPSGRREEQVGGPASPATGGPGAAYELYNLGTELRHAADQLKDYSYLVLRVPTEESWAFAQSGGTNLEEAPPYPLWIPRREAVVVLARTHGLEIQCVAEDTVAFHNWTSRFFPSITVTLASTQETSRASGASRLERPLQWAGKLFSALRHLFAGKSRTCFVFQKIPGASRGV